MRLAYTALSCCHNGGYGHIDRRRYSFSRIRNSLHCNLLLEDKRYFALSHRLSLILVDFVTQFYYIHRTQNDAIEPRSLTEESRTLKI